jgi:hypothetical protein
MVEDNIKRRTIMKNGWLIQKEQSDNGMKITAQQDKILKDKSGKIVGRSSVHKQVYFSSLKDNKDSPLDKNHEYKLEEEEL